MARQSIYRTEEGQEEVLNFYEELLSEWPQPLHSSVLKTSFGDTFVIECGKTDGPVIILLHGSGSNSAMWMGDVKLLSEDYHLYVVDIIGECGNSSEHRPAFKDGHYAHWLNEITELLGHKSVSLIGCSLGGWIALDFAKQYSEKTERLILLASGGLTAIRPKMIFWVLLTSLMGAWGFKKLNQMVYGGLDIDAKALEFAILLKKHYKPRTDILPVFTDSELSRIKAKTLYIGGAQDCFYNSEKAADHLKKYLVHAHTIVLEDTGHVLLNQTSRILKFLKEK